MRLLIRLIFTTIFVLFAANSSNAFCQSENSISENAGTDIQKSKSQKTGNARFLVKFPMPEYIFSDSGVVVVIVRISKNGRVTKAQVDKIKSTTQNKMLYNEALKAAYYAKYNKIDKDTVETGQLTYKFKQK
jgi:TonB family protein